MATPRKEQILDAAMVLFAAKGVDGTTVTEIEAAVGLTPGSGSFYRHYGSKDEVLAAAVDRAIARSEQDQARRRASAAAEVPGQGDLAAQYLEVLETLDDMGPLIDLLARERGRLPGIAEHLQASMVETGVAAEGAVARGQDAPAVGAVVLSSLVGYHLSRRFFGAPPGGVSADIFAETLAGLVHDQEVDGG